MWVTECQSVKQQMCSRLFGEFHSEKVMLRKPLLMEREDTDLLKPSSRPCLSPIPCPPDKRQLPTDCTVFLLWSSGKFLFFPLLTLPFKCSSVWLFFHGLVPLQERSTHWEAVSPTLPGKLIIWCFRDVFHFDINHGFHLKLVFQKKDSAERIQGWSRSQVCVPFLLDDLKQDDQLEDSHLTLQESGLKHSYHLLLLLLLPGVLAVVATVS